MTAHRLETNRLILRPFQMDDLAGYAHLLPGLPNSLTGEATLFPNHSPAQLQQKAAEALALLLAMQDTYPIAPLAVTLKTTGGLLGYCGVRPLPEAIAPKTRADHSHDGELELLYMLGKPFWGHGLATEAVTECVVYGLTIFKAPRITGLTRADNLASIRVMEKAGLQHEGQREGFGHIFEAYSLARSSL